MSGNAGNGPCATCGREHIEGVWWPRHPYIARVRIGEPISVREAARRRQPLDGADAQALEGALSATERERDQARLAASAAMGDLVSLALACDQRDDEYPRQAIERREREHREDLDLLSRWILDHRKYVTGACDHACARCVPGGPLVSTTFVCAMHRSEDIQAALREGA